MIELGILYEEDCFETMKRLPDKSIDLLLTDPPWPQANSSLLGKGDELDSIRRLMDCAQRICKRLIVVLGSYCDPACLGEADNDFPFFLIVPLRYIPALYKGTVLREFDIAYVYGSRALPIGRRVFPGSAENVYIASQRVKVDHPCIRPLSHMERLISGFSNPGDIVYDPFAGSGTTLVAANNLGRRWIGSEFDPRWIQEAKNRIAGSREQTLLRI
jgi:DNA modification methylase